MKKIIITKKNIHNCDKVHLKAISRKTKAKESAYDAGRRIAKKWIKCASTQEIKDALPRPDPHHDTNYFVLVRNIYFKSIEEIYPDETNNFKWFNNFDFMTGWREEVISLWNIKQEKIN
jgi:hypothetical protein